MTYPTERGVVEEALAVLAGGTADGLVETTPAAPRG
jgi:hypothetical protein